MDLCFRRQQVVRAFYIIELLKELLWRKICLRVRIFSPLLVMAIHTSHFRTLIDPHLVHSIL